MNFDLDAELRPLLTAGERLLWTGRPKAGLAFRSTDALMIPFSLLWFGFVIFWMITASAMGGGLFSLFGVPFLLVGLYITAGRFVADALKRKKTVYGITDGRVIIKSGLFSPHIKSLPLKTLADVTYREKRDGSGTITFGPADLRINPWGGNGTWPGTRTPPALEMIPDVQKVYNLLLRQQRNG